MSFITRSGAYSSRRGGIVPPPVGIPYEYYTNLIPDQMIPYVMGAGAWGIQEDLNAPAAPVITNTVVVNNDSEFAAASVSGNRIVLADNTTYGDQFLIGLTDIDIVAGANVTMGLINTVGSMSRLRIRNYMAGVTGTFLFDGVNAGSGGIEDLIVDGTLIRDTGIHGGDYLYRAAIVRCAMRAPGNLCDSLDTTDIVIAGCNVVGGSGWIVRAEHQYLRFNIFENDFRSTANAQIRPGMNATGQPASRGFWVDSNVLINSTQWQAGSEGGILRTSNSSGETVPIESVWCTNNRVHGSNFLNGSMECQPTNGRVNYVDFSGNRYISGDGTSPPEPAAGVGETYVYGSNTRVVIGAPDTALPAWGPAGDPTLIP